MDALCDPRAFLSAQEKRGEQLKALGIEETDISGDVIQSKGGDKKSSDGKGDGKKEEKKGKLLSCWVCSTRVMTKTKKADLKKNWAWVWYLNSVLFLACPVRKNINMKTLLKHFWPTEMSYWTPTRAEKFHF